METQKRNIAIVCGGDSSEHDVSMRSAQGLYSFFDKERYNIYVVDVKGQDWHVDLQNGDTAKIDKNDFSFKMDGKTVTFDYAYITIHGTPGENGVMQGYFELLHIPYSTSGVLVEAMTFDKYVLNNYLRGWGVNVAKSILVRRGEESKYSDEFIEKEIGMPCFVKPAARTSSARGVHGERRGDDREFHEGHRDINRLLQDTREVGSVPRYGGSDKQRVLRLRR